MLGTHFKYIYIIFPCIVCMYVMIFAYKVNTRLFKHCICTHGKKIQFFTWQFIWLNKIDVVQTNQYSCRHPFQTKYIFYVSYSLILLTIEPQRSENGKIGYFINKKYLLIISKYNTGHACTTRSFLSRKIVSFD